MIPTSQKLTLCQSAHRNKHGSKYEWKDIITTGTVTYRLLEHKQINRSEYIANTLTPQIQQLTPY